MEDLYIEDNHENLQELRTSSAYSEVRFLINLLLFLNVIGGIFGVSYYLYFLNRFGILTPSFGALIVALALLGVLVSFILRGLAFALLDIADVQLRQTGRKGD